jgi:hypothetical protein
MKGLYDSAVLDADTDADEDEDPIADIKGSITCSCGSGGTQLAAKYTMRIEKSD